ncbi:histidinol-phosphate aminotransferase family protein [Bradyrhizobium lablabi]|nr:histidinol-phosphate aminotransferase family protein [Bradyrhizobium lablabi]
MSRRDCIAATGIALAGLGRTSQSAGGAGGSLPRARLSLNENPFGPSDFAVAAIRKELHQISRYADRESGGLAQALAMREGVALDQILFGEILDALGFQLALNGPTGGEFIYSEPGYTAPVDAAVLAGARALGVPLDQQLENDLPAIAAKVSAKTQAIYLVNPHNPSGTVTDGVQFRRFVQKMSTLATVIVDEAYLEFEPDFDERTVVGLTRAGDNVIVFRTFSKMFGLAGLSFGYAVAPRAHAASLRRAGVGTSESINRLVIAAVTGSLGDTDYVTTTRSKVVAERKKWHRLFEAMNVRHSESRANFVFFETGRPHAEFAAALRAEGVDIGRAFPPLDSWARISIGLPEENDIARKTVAKLLG